MSWFEKKILGILGAGENDNRPKEGNKMFPQPW